MSLEKHAAAVQAPLPHCVWEGWATARALWRCPPSSAVRVTSPLSPVSVFPLPFSVLFNSDL